MKNLQKKLSKYAVAGTFALIVTMPFVASAQFVPGSLMLDPNAPGTMTVTSDTIEKGFVQNTSIDGGIGADNPKASNFQLIPCDGVEVKCDFNMVIILANRVIKFLLYLSIPMVMGMILYTGWLYLTANGETGQIEKAKKMFVPIIIGMFWIGAAYILVYTVIDKFVSEQFVEDAKGAVKILK